MNVTFEQNGEARGLITVSICPEDYEGKVTEKLKKIRQTHVIPGFRKGQIPVPELRKRFGREVKSEVINDVVIEAAFKHITDNNIRVIGQPMPAQDSKEINLKDSDYTFSFDCALWPELNIVLDKSVTLPVYKIEVTDEMVAEQDKHLCERFGAQVEGEEVDDRAIVKGSLQELNEDGTVKEGEGAIQLTSAMLGMFALNGEEAKFIGKHVGDKVVFNPAQAAKGNAAHIASMLQIDKEAAANVTADFEFAIAEIQVLKPAEHNQEFFDDVFGKDKVHNEEEYTAAVRGIIANQLFPNSIEMSNRDIREYLVEKYGDMKLDDELLKRWLVRMNNMNADTIDQDYVNALPGIKWELISSDVAELLKVEVTKEDLQARARMYAAQQFQQYGMYNADEDMLNEMAKRILENKEYARNIHQELETLKLFDAVRAAITLDEKTVSLDEFKKLANPNAEEAAE